MSIVYVKDKKSGTVYAYESEAKWIPELKQSRPVRTYLGRVDPLTQTIIPSAGRRGRRKKEEDPISNRPAENGGYKVLYEETLEKNRTLEGDLKDARHQVASLTKRLGDAQKQLEHIEQMVQKAMASMSGD